MAEFGLAIIGLKLPDAQRLRATVGMVTVAGSVSKGWRLCPPSEADLLVIAHEDPEARAALENRAAFPRATFAALVGEADVAPPRCLSLSWPIRTDHVVRLLKSVEESKKAGPTVPEAAESGIFELASLLRRAADECDPEVVWKIDGTPDHALYVLPAARKFLYRAPLPRLRGMPPDVTLDFENIDRKGAPHDVSPRPLVALNWMVGSLTGPLGVLPWIDTKSALRMRRWPDFPVLYHDPRHRRIAALLSEHVRPMSDLVRLAGVDSATVTGFVNAASLCGYLVADATPTAPGAGEGGSDGSRRSLIGRLRQALGIVEA